MAKRKLIIDGQIFQTAAKDRGMGRYSVCLLEALIATQTSYQEVEIVLTQNLPTSETVLEELRASFKGAKLQLLDLRITSRSKIEEAFDHNRRVLTEHVKGEQTKGFEVDYLVPSLFQEPVAAVFPDNARKFAVFYDLIPYLYHRRYKPVMNYTNYLKRFTHLFEAELIFTISQTVADDLHKYLGLPMSRLVRIDGAAIRSDKTPQQPPVNLPEKFILMPTSDDPRKNNLRAVLGFEEFRNNGAGQLDYKLVITSKIHRREKEYLQLFSRHLIFTGNLPEEQLEWLYGHCETVLFTPEYEGLGLPILEAVEFNKTVVCSSISVFEEISENTFAYCDHENPSSIAEAISKALTSQPDQKVYKTIADYYSWPRTAKRLLNGIQNYRAPAAINKPKIAVFTPSLEDTSAVAKLVTKAHAVLSEHFEIDYYSDNTGSPKAAEPHFLNYIAPVHPATVFGVKSYRDYEAVIYHIDNDNRYQQVIKNALYLPGYVVLHSTDLTATYQGLVEAELMPVERLQIEERLDNLSGNPHTSHLITLLNRQLGALTFSKQACKAIADQGVGGGVAEAVMLPSFTTSDRPSTEKTGDKLIIGVLGSIDDAKNAEFIETLATEPGLYSATIWLIDFDETSVENVERFNLYENISVISDPTDFEFHQALNKLDIFIDRSSESTTLPSLAAIEAMAYGLILAVGTTGWGSELPTDAVLQAADDKALLKELQLLAKNPQQLNSISKLAKRCSSRNSNYEQFASSIEQLISQKLSTQNVNHQLTQQLKAGQLKSARQYVKFLEGKL